VQPLSNRIAEIELLMQYAVPPDQRPEAAALVKKYDSDGIALNIFHSFYSFLPEGLDDAIKILRLLTSREGTFLICASTLIGDYLYLANGERAEFLGSFSEGIEEEEVLEFFRLKDREAFLKKYADLGQFPVYVPAFLHSNLCPACQAGDGELHALGCPVEICPWCGGQLTSCPCRFKLLARDRLHTESQLDALKEKLEKKGRVPFNAEEHRPDYPLTPADLK